YEVGKAVVVEIGSTGRQRPASGIDARFTGDVLKLSVAEIFEQVLSPAVLCVLKALGHHQRVFERPEIDVITEISAQKHVEQAVAVIIEPHSGVDICPFGKA